MFFAFFRKTFSLSLFWWWERNLGPCTCFTEAPLPTPLVLDFIFKNFFAVLGMLGKQFPETYKTASPLPVASQERQAQEQCWHPGKMLHTSHGRRHPGQKTLETAGMAEGVNLD